MRADRPDETIIEAAVSRRKGEINFFASGDNGLSTGRGDIAIAHRNAGFQFVETIVPTITLDNVFKRLGGPCDWLKIDVEGMEAEVIESWNSCGNRPLVVLVEATLPNSQTPCFAEWEPMLLAKGYEFVYFDALNRWYLRKDSLDHREALTAPISLFDKFQLTRFHFPAARMRVQEALELERQVNAATQHNQAELERVVNDQLVTQRAQHDRLAHRLARQSKIIAGRRAQNRELLARMQQLSQEFTRRIEQAVQNQRPMPPRCAPRLMMQKHTIALWKWHMARSTNGLPSVQSFSKKRWTAKPRCSRR